MSLPASLGYGAFTPALSPTQRTIAALEATIASQIETIATLSRHVELLEQQDARARAAIKDIIATLRPQEKGL